MALQDISDELTRRIRAWDALATKMDSQLSFIDADADVEGYIDALTDADMDRLSTFAIDRRTAATKQLALLQSVQESLGQVLESARAAARGLNVLLPDFEVLDSIPPQIRDAWIADWVAKGATPKQAKLAIARLENSAFVRSLRRDLYARPLQAVKAYDAMALSALRSLAGAQLAEIIATSRRSDESMDLSAFETKLDSLQERAMAALEDSGKPTALQPIADDAQTLLIALGEHLEITTLTGHDAIRAGVKVRQALRTTAAINLGAWYSGWTGLEPGHNILDDARAHQSLEWEESVIPTDALGVDELLASPPTDGATVTVIGMFGALEIIEHGGHATSWCPFSSMESKSSMFVLDGYAKLDTSGQSPNTVGIISGKFDVFNSRTKGPTIFLGHGNSDIAAHRWRTALDGIYAPRVHHEHVWWSWNISQNLGAGNPLLYGKWWI